MRDSLAHAVPLGFGLVASLVLDRLVEQLQASRVDSNESSRKSICSDFSIGNPIANGTFIHCKGLSNLGDGEKWFHYEAVSFFVSEDRKESMNSDVR